VNGTLRLATVLLRRNRVVLGAWAGGVLALVAVTIPSYAATYPSLAARASLVEQLRSNVATKVLYGVLPSPGTLGQLAVWETGTYVALLVAVLGVLLGVRLGRGEEWAGHCEVVRSVGAGRSAPVAAALVVLAGTFVVIGGGVAAVLAWQSRSTAEVSVTGAWHFGAVVVLVGLGFGVSTLLLGELLPTPTLARSAGWVLLGVDFVLRVVADFGASSSGLRWLSWLGLSHLVGPFTSDRTLPVVVAALGVCVLAGVTVLLDARRELGAGLLSLPSGSTRSLSVGGPLALGWRLGRAGWWGWAAAAAAVAGLFGGMSHGLVTLLRDDPSSSDLVSSVTGVAAGPVRGYFVFTVIFVALVPLLHAVSHTLVAASGERTGLLDTSLAVGVPRWAPLAAQAGLAAVRALGLVLVAAGVQAATSEAAGSGDDAVAWAFWSVLATAPGILAAVGITASLVGLLPRFASFAWLLVAWSLFAALVGQLVRLPDWARSTSLLTHTPRTLDLSAGRDLGTTSMVVLVAVAAATTALALVAMTRRDVVVSRPGVE
jgi:ABC-2 type transport system permease protein